MNILLTGGSGLIGRALIPHLLASGHQLTVVTRFAHKSCKHMDWRINVITGLKQLSHLNDFGAVINLAGEPIADKRWSAHQKQLLCHSRWDMTGELVRLIKASQTPPGVFISASAIGFYGNQGETLISEQTPAKEEFTHTLCQRWEQIALEAQSAQTRVCLLRTGVVLAPHGGILAKMLPAFRLGLGGRIGSGRQFLPWIHIEDMVRGILWLLTHPIHGPFNLVAPSQVSQADFARTLAKQLKRPAWFRLPGCVLRVLMGEAAVLVLGGQRALPRRLEESGFSFLYPQLVPALQNVLAE